MEIELWVSLSLWIFIMLAAFFVEIQTNDFVSLGIMLSAITAAIFSSFNNDLLIQLVVFVIAAVALTTALFLFIKKEDKEVKDINDGRLIGKTFILNKQDSRTGQFIVRDSGIEWFIKSNDLLAVGTKVKINKIEGSKLVASVENGNKVK